MARGVREWEWGEGTSRRAMLNLDRKHITRVIKVISLQFFGARDILYATSLALAPP